MAYFYLQLINVLKIWRERPVNKETFNQFLLEKEKNTLYSVYKSRNLLKKAVHSVLSLIVTRIHLLVLIFSTNIQEKNMSGIL